MISGTHGGARTGSRAHSERRRRRRRRAAPPAAPRAARRAAPPSPSPPARAARSASSARAVPFSPTVTGRRSAAERRRSEAPPPRAVLAPAAGGSAAGAPLGEGRERAAAARLGSTARWGTGGARAEEVEEGGFAGGGEGVPSWREDGGGVAGGGAWCLWGGWRGRGRGRVGRHRGGRLVDSASRCWLSRSMPC